MNEIEFIAVDKNYPHEVVDKGIHFFPDDVSARNFRIGKGNVIYLNEIPDKNCKKCYGTGKLGDVLHYTPLSPDEIVSVMMQCKEPEKLPQVLLRVLHLPSEMLKSLEILVSLMHKPDYKTYRDYALKIKRDYPTKETIFCECFKTNFDKQVQETLRNIKFSTN